MTFDIASLTGNKIGIFCDMETENSGKVWGASMRIRVTLNVTLPLYRALRICATFGEEFMVSFTYKRPQNFCYLCSMLGHISRYCEERFEDDFVDPERFENSPYGPWLRASLCDRGPNKPSSFAGSTSPKLSGARACCLKRVTRTCRIWGIRVLMRLQYFPLQPPNGNAKRQPLDFSSLESLAS
ncbi:UNVERIFIED_CONTAM: hypothetical protein Sindi_2556200 [Sesamum indicum]